MVTNKEPIWIVRDLLKCSGCRKCEIACSLLHEERIWPEASRIRVFMLVPGVEFPHFCVQCEDYPCVEVCPFTALSINDKTSAVSIDNDLCTGCGKCIEACPGRIPHMHPVEKHILICDLCDGDPECVKVCRAGGWNVLKIVQRKNYPYQLYSRKPEEITRELTLKLYGDVGKVFL